VRLEGRFYQETLPYKPLAGRFRRKICLLQAFVQEKSPLKRLFGFLGQKQVAMRLT
jgi:hypothetical protein